MLTEAKRLKWEGGHGAWNDPTRVPSFEIEEVDEGMKLSLNGVNERGEPCTIAIKFCDPNQVKKLRLLFTE